MILALVFVRHCFRMAGFSICSLLLLITIFNSILSDTNVSASQGTETISRKVSLLREQMRLHNISAYIITDGDEHQTDYIVAERDRRRAWISGFSGLQGDAVVTMNKTALWTLKSLWFLAKQEIPSDWILMESCPGLTSKYLPIEAWLLNELEPGSRVGADPNVAYTQWIDWDQKLRWKNISLVPLEENLIDLIWKDQPGFRKDPLYDLPLKITGQTQEEKLKLIREDMAELKTDLYVVSALDEIAWITNMRGSDIPYVPVFRSHMLIGKDFAKVYLPPEKQGSKVLRILNLANIAVFDYDQFWMDLKAYSEQAHAILLPKSYNNALGVSYKIFDTIPREKVRSKVSPILLRKDRKNFAEIAGMKQAHLREAVAMTQWMMKMENDMENNSLIRESDAIERLREIRYKQQFSRGESSECVAGYGPNSANFFHIPKNKSAIEIGKDKTFMITTGGQYDDGTTRIARTLHYGIPTEHQKSAYTALLAGIIDLVKLIFPSGTSACTTDIVIQMPLYRIGQEYEYETIQGIGASLGVYEAFNDTYDVNAFRIQGIGYRQGREWGILLENVVTVVAANTTFKPEKQFMTFKMITLMPYERNLINPNQLTNEQLEWLNKYHEEVRSKVGAELGRQGDEITRKWLNTKTEPLKRIDNEKNKSGYKFGK